MTLSSIRRGLYAIVEARLDADTARRRRTRVWSELASRVDSAEYRPHLVTTSR